MANGTGCFLFGSSAVEPPSCDTSREVSQAHSCYLHRGIQRKEASDVTTRLLSLAITVTDPEPFRIMAAVMSNLRSQHTRTNYRHRANFSLLLTRNTNLRWLKQIMAYRAPVTDQVPRNVSLEDQETEQSTITKSYTWELSSWQATRTTH